MLNRLKEYENIEFRNDLETFKLPPFTKTTELFKRFNRNLFVIKFILHSAAIKKSTG